jgi:hypothetical protein
MASMSRSRASRSTPQQEHSPGQGGGAALGFGGPEGSMLAIQSMGGNAFAQSMLQGGVGEALVDCFGPAVAGVEIHGGEDAPNDDIGALGSAEGHRVSLSSDVDPAQGDRQSLEVLGHEVAHAMAPGRGG